MVVTPVVKVVNVEGTSLVIVIVDSGAPSVPLGPVPAGRVPVGPGGKMPLAIPAGRVPAGPRGKMPLPVPAGRIPVGPGGRMPLSVPTRELSGGSLLSVLWWGIDTHAELPDVGARLSGTGRSGGGAVAVDS